MEKQLLRPIWKYRDYMILWSGQTVSSLGSAFSQFASPLLVLYLTNSAAQAGFAGAFGVLPYLLFSLPAGAYIDRWNRKKVMILCDTIRTLNMACVALALLLGHITVLQLYIAAFVEGTFFVFFNLAETACLPHLVPREQLPQATAQNAISDSATVLIGPPLAGIIYQAFGPMLSYLFDAISYLVSVISLCFTQTDFQENREPGQRKLLDDIKEGISWLWQQRLIRFMAFLTGALNLIGASCTLIIIVRAREMGASPQVIGIIFAVSGVGGILGSLIGGKIQQRYSFSQVVIAVGWLRALLWPLYALVPLPLLLGVVDAGLYIIGPVYNVTQFSYRMALIPDRLQGRVNSVFRLLAYGMIPIGYALCGILIQNWGAIWTAGIFAAGMWVVALITTLNRHVRAAPPLKEIQMENARVAPQNRS